MFPMSPFIRALKQGPFPKNVRFVSIYSRDDGVCFYKSAMLDVPSNNANLKNVEISGMNHVDLVIRKAAYNVIRKELRTGEHPLSQKRKKIRSSSAKRRVKQIAAPSQVAQVLPISRRS